MNEAGRRGVQSGLHAAPDRWRARVSSLSIPAIAQVRESAISARPAWTTLKPRRLIRMRTAGSLSPIPTRRVPRLWKVTSAPCRLRTAVDLTWMACDVVASSRGLGSASIAKEHHPLERHAPKTQHTSYRLADLVCEKVAKKDDGESRQWVDIPMHAAP